VLHLPLVRGPILFITPPQEKRERSHLVVSIQRVVG
jgi:hypothetical protein